MLYQFIVYSKKRNVMLFNTCNDKLSFPHFRSKPFHIAEVKLINDYFQNHYQLCVNVLKCWRKEESRFIYEVEVLNPEIPYGVTCADWIDPFDPVIFNTLHEQEQWILQQWKKNDTTQMPWFQYGFRDEIDKWVGRQLSGSLCAIEQIRSWEKGLLLKVHGHNTHYYVKTVPPIFNHEPFVHKSMPDYVPEIMSIDEKKNTYMMREMTGTLLGYSQDIQKWKMTTRRVAKLQEKYLHDELHINVSIPKRPIETVLTAVNMTETIKLLQNYISGSSYQKLCKSIPEVLSLVQLLKFKSLASVDHGDLFGGNVIVENEEPIIFDWSNSSITHPFLSVVHLVEEVTDFFSEDLSRQVLREYLCEWTAYGHINQLDDEFSIVQLLEPIYYLTVHMLHIFPAFQDNVDKEEIIDTYVTKWLNNFTNITKHV